MAMADGYKYRLRYTILFDPRQKIVIRLSLTLFLTPLNEATINHKKSEFEKGPAFDEIRQPSSAIIQLKYYEDSVERWKKATLELQRKDKQHQIHGLKLQKYHYHIQSQSSLRNKSRRIFIIRFACSSLYQKLKGKMFTSKFTLFKV